MNGKRLSLAIFILLVASLLAAAAEQKTPMPTNPVVWQKGQVYKIGQAVKDPKSGLVFLVNQVKFDGGLPGLSTGDEWALVELTLGNVGKQMITVRPLGDLGIKVNGAKSFLTEPVHADLDLGNKAGAEPMVNTDIPPGQAVRCLFTVKVPSAGKDLALWYAQGLILGTNAPDSALIEVSLGR